MGTTPKQVLSQLEALAGENEAVVGSNNTTINKHYNWRGAAYCGLAVKYAFEMAGSTLVKGCTGIANVGELARWAEAQGWRVSTPQAGDIFVEGANAHTGFVDEVLGNGYFLTVEGNYGHVKATKEQAKNGTGASFEGIGYRKAAYGNFKFYHPPYDGTTPAPAPTPTKITVTLNVEELSKAKQSTGALVKTVQRICYAYGFTGNDGRPLTIDGDFGANTDGAVRKLQKHLGLGVDGIVGKDTWTAMLTKLT